MAIIARRVNPDVDDSDYGFHIVRGAYENRRYDHYFTDDARLEIVKMLLEAGVDYSLKNDKGKTARDLAEANELSEIVLLLDDWAQEHQLKKEL